MIVSGVVGWYVWEPIVKPVEKTYMYVHHIDIHTGAPLNYVKPTFL